MPTPEERQIYNKRYREKLKQRKEQQVEQRKEQVEEVEEMGSRENATSYSEEEEENDLITNPNNHVAVITTNPLNP